MTTTTELFHDCQDMFPDKATVNFGAQYSITYNNSFKILTNYQMNPPKTYALYQRGCPQPIGLVSSPLQYFEYLALIDLTWLFGHIQQTADLMVPVPVTHVYVRSSTFLKWIEIIGERSSIIGVNGLYTASPCLNKRFIAKQTADFSSSIVKYNNSGFFLVCHFCHCINMRSSQSPL